MDRLSGDLDRERSEEGKLLDAADLSLDAVEQAALRASTERLGLPEKLFNLEELEALFQSESASLWTFMRPKGRPSFTPAMLGDFEAWQKLIAQGFGPGRVPLRYLVLGSRAPGVFCFGGDLELFAQLIRTGNRAGLVNYGRRCVEILDRNIRALDLPMVTIGLVQGQALGGGFEAVLSFDFIIAERGSTFGLPEIKFGLFPGMGAHPILTRKVGAAMADRMILSDEVWTAERLYDLGVVHQLAEPGEGVAAVNDFIARSERRHAGMVGARRASRETSPIPMTEFYNIVDHWAEAALKLREQDLKLMQRLANAQSKLAKAA
jgi:DSF synthase